jgi:hypothetical protein
MKCLIVVAFTVCSCAVAYAQQTNSQKDTPPVQRSLAKQIQVTPFASEVGPPPEPLFVISEGGIKKEASKEDLEKISITQVASVELLVDRESLEEYGEKGKNGVMIICLKEN